MVCYSFMERETSETFENLNLTACLVIRYHSDKLVQMESQYRI